MIKIECKVIEKSTGKIAAFRSATKATRELALQDIVEQVEVGFGPVGEDGDYDLEVNIEEEI